MNNLTVREKFILNSIIGMGPLTIKGLSSQIGVSERTILRELSAINDWLKKYSIHICDRGGKLHAGGSRENIERIKEHLQGIPFMWLLTQEQRQMLITAQLLLSNEPIKSAYFSYQFNVVEGTVIFYLDKIESWLEVKNLKLVRKRGYGLEVEGSEWDKRNAFAELLYNYKPISELLGFLYGGKNDYLLDSFFKVAFGEELINTTGKLLKKLEETNILKDNDVGYFGAYLHILLAIERTRSGSPIELPGHLVCEILSSNEYLYIKDVDKILKERGINLSDNELAYLAVHLNGDKNIYREDSESRKLGFDLNELVAEVVYIAGKRLNTKINCDNQLMSGLIQHITPALYRLTMGLKLRNPVLNEIKEYYPDLYSAVDYACRLVFSKYNLTIPENEVGYITMHIGAALERQDVIEPKLSVLIICSNGISTARILYNKLKKNFPELDRIEICSLREMKDKINDGYDIILSTVNINKNLYGNVEIVSPFLPKKDIAVINCLIKEKLGECSGLSRHLMPLDEESYNDCNTDFEAANNIFKNFQLKNISAGSLKDAVKAVVNEIYTSDIIRNRDIVESEINKREEQGNVVIPKSRTALIHIRTDEIDNPFVGAYRLKDYINIKVAGFSSEKVDTLLVMLARKNESNYILELLGKISISMVENRSFTEVLRLGDIKDIRNELIDILNREEY